MRVRSSFLIAGGLLACAILGYAAGAKSYQVTGPITDISADTITVTKGSEAFQINLPKGTKGAEGLKKGDKVTVFYAMTATSVESKAAPAKAEPKTAAPKKAGAKK
ncbi:MAG: hypothetical protein IPQ13_14665 [Holophagaceae bacterium]|nr:hypothetical protein [Holophagaceae bacterium]